MIALFLQFLSIFFVGAILAVHYDDGIANLSDLDSLRLTFISIFLII